MIRRIVPPLIGILLVGFLPTVAPAIDWNRRVTPGDIQFKNAIGQIILTPRYREQAMSPNAVGQNLNATIRILRNGNLVASVPLSATVFAAGAGNNTCISACNKDGCGSTAGIYCDTDCPPPIACTCGVIIYGNSLTLPFNNGDLLTYQLVAAPGSAPEQDTSDDTASLVVGSAVPAAGRGPLFATSLLIVGLACVVLTVRGRNKRLGSGQRMA